MIDPRFLNQKENISHSEEEQEVDHFIRNFQSQRFEAFEYGSVLGTFFMSVLVLILILVQQHYWAIGAVLIFVFLYFWSGRIKPKDLSSDRLSALFEIAEHHKGKIHYLWPLGCLLLIVTIIFETYVYLDLYSKQGHFTFYVPGSLLMPILILARCQYESKKLKQINSYINNLKGEGIEIAF